MLSKKLLDELEVILREEFNLVLSRKELDKFARNLTGYFDLLGKLHYENKQNGKS